MSMQQFNLAERHKDFDIKVMEKLKHLSLAEIENLASPEARTIYNWNRQVAGCYQRSRAFSRLEINKHSMIHCFIEPEHYVEDLVAKWFLSRFPIFTVIVGSQRGTFVISKRKQLEVYDKSIEDLIPKFEKKLPKNEILTELGNFNEDVVWEQYYNSQMIKERKNKRYFLHNMPKKFLRWKSLGIENGIIDKNMKLNKWR